MPPALQCVSASKAAITGGAFETLSAAGGDSLTVFAFDSPANCWLLTAWGISSDAAFEFDIRSPRLHDNVRGIRLAGSPLFPGAVTANGCQILLPRSTRQPFYSADPLVVEVNGTAADDAVLSWLVYYENLKGISANLATYEEIQNRIVNYVGLKVAPTASATPGTFGATVALNSSETRLQADLSYALLGATTTVPFVTCRVKGPDTGNLGVGIPMGGFSEISCQWFIELARAHPGLPLIPIIQANNQGSTNIDIVDGEASTAPTIDLVLAELM